MPSIISFLCYETIRGEKKQNKTKKTKERGHLLKKKQDKYKSLYIHVEFLIRGNYGKSIEQQQQQQQQLHPVPYKSTLE